MTPPAHPIALVRRQAQTAGQGRVLLETPLEIAPRVLLHSRRAARLLERVGLERPTLRLSGLLAELGREHKGVPAILVDKLAFALHALFAGAPPTAHELPRDGPLRTLAVALDELEATTRGDDPPATVRPRVARVTLDESPPAFFYSEGRGFDAVPNGMAVMLAELGRRPLAFVPVRGPMLDVESRLYAIERMRDVVLEPIHDEGARLLSMLVAGNVVRLALITGGGLRLTLKDRALAAEIGLEEEDADEGEPGRYTVFSPARARDVLAELAARDDVTLAWSSADRIRTARAAPAHLRVRLGEGRDWLGVEGALDFEGRPPGEVAAELADVLRAVREGRRYVVVRGDAGERLIALTDALARALEPLAAAPSAPALGALLDAGVRVDEGDAGAAARANGGAATRPTAHANDALAALARARAVDGEPSAALHAILRPYQKDGLRFLRRLVAWRTGGVLADDMGLGKTVQAIALLLDRASGPALVVAPTSVCFNWADELTRFAPTLRALRYEGAPPIRAAALARVAPGDVVIASYALLQRDAAALARVRFATAIFDEAQHIKNASTRRARAARALDAEQRVALTGTPLENHTGELWAIFDAVAPGLFGSWSEFKARFATPVEKDADARRRRTLARAIAPFVLRRKKRDVAPELPPRTDVIQHLTLDAGERRTYERTRQALLFDLLRPDKDPKYDDGKPSAAERRVKVLAAITRLRLVACHASFAGDTVLPPADTPPGTKQRALVELLLELRGEGHNVLVFSQFVRHLELARAAATAAGVTSLQLDGSTPAKERPGLVERFQAGEVDAFFISLKAGGTGLNLVRASYVVHLDPWWNPAVEDQASDRAHRIGQTQPVTVVRLVAEDTLEEEMLELHEHKRALVEGVLEGTAAAGTLSVDDLVALLRRSRRTARPEDDAQELAD